MSTRRVELVLQDYDELVEANDSTSLLTTLKQIGRKKTRAMAVWCAIPLRMLWRRGSMVPPNAG